MDVEDLVACVYPLSDLNGDATNAITTSRYYVPPPLSDRRPKKVQYMSGEREITESPEEEGATTSKHGGRPFIEIRFSKIPRSSHGVIFGRNKKSDVLLPDIKGLSSFHFSLTFDEQKRLIVKDLGSLIGTEVTYDTEGGGARRNFSWIIGGDRRALRAQNVVINIREKVQFQIVAIKHNIKSPSYIDNVEKFCQGSVTAEGLLDDLNLPLRPDTQFATGAHTPGECPIYLKKEIGKGGFGIATYCWDVSTGHETVIKTPREDTIQRFLRRGVNSVKSEAALAHDRGLWKREANNMKKLIHVSIPLRSWRHGANLNSLILYGCSMLSTIHTPNWSWNISQKVPCPD